MKRATDLLLVVALALIALLLILVGPEHGAARALAAVPLILVLPGLAVTAATFPYPTLTMTERVLLSTGLSLALVAMGGLLLNMLPDGLNTTSWAVFSMVIILVGCGTAFFRRSPTETPTQRRGLELGWRQATMFGLAGVIVALALGISARGELNQPNSGFTQLWMLPSDTATTSVRVGIANHDTAEISYRLQVQAEGRAIQEWPVDLRPGATWEQTLSLPLICPRRRGSKRSFTALMLRGFIAKRGSTAGKNDSVVSRYMTNTIHMQIMD